MFPVTIDKTSNLTSADLSFTQPVNAAIKKGSMGAFVIVDRRLLNDQLAFLRLYQTALKPLSQTGTVHWGLASL